jgi:hypothetical protein
MRPDMGRAGPEGPARNALVTRQGTESRSAPRVTPARDDLAAHRELRAWQRAAEHLNARGLSACVPCELLAALRRRGLAVWCQERAA